jgi:hypothetical protein
MFAHDATGPHRTLTLARHHEQMPVADAAQMGRHAWRFYQTGQTRAETYYADDSASPC